MVINKENGEKRKLKQFKHLKWTQSRRETHACSLRERFESNIQVIRKTVWQNEKDFTVEVPINLQNDHVYGKGKKSDIPDETLLRLTKKMSKKVMVSAAIS